MGTAAVAAEKKDHQASEVGGRGGGTGRAAAAVEGGRGPEVAGAGTDSCLLSV